MPDRSFMFARRQEPELVELLDEGPSVHPPAGHGLHPRLEHVGVRDQMQLIGESGDAHEHFVGAPLRPRRRGADGDALVGPVVALDGADGEVAPLVQLGGRSRSSRSMRSLRTERLVEHAVSW